MPPKTCDKAMPQHESPALSNSGSQLSFYNVCKDDPIKAKRSGRSQEANAGVHKTRRRRGLFMSGL